MASQVATTSMTKKKSKQTVPLSAYCTVCSGAADGPALVSSEFSVVQADGLLFFFRRLLAAASLALEEEARGEASLRATLDVSRSGPVLRALLRFDLEEDFPCFGLDLAPVAPLRMRRARPLRPTPPLLPPCLCSGCGCASCTGADGGCDGNDGAARAGPEAAAAAAAVAGGSHTPGAVETETETEDTVSSSSRLQPSLSTRLSAQRDVLCSLSKDLCPRTISLSNDRSLERAMAATAAA